MAPQAIRSALVVGTADEVEVDICTRAWKVDFAAAITTALEAVIERVRVPYLNLRTLIASKETYREQEQMDLIRLRALKAAQTAKTD